MPINTYRRKSEIFKLPFVNYQSNKNSRDFNR